MQIAFHYQKHVYFRNGHIVMGGVPNSQVTSKKSVKAVGFVFILGIMMWDHGNCQIFLCTYRYVYAESSIRLPCCPHLLNLLSWILASES